MSVQSTIDDRTAEVIRSAVAEAQAGRIREACAIGERGLANGCEPTPLHAMIGSLLVRSGDLTSAIPHLRAAHQARPGDLIITKNFAAALIGCERYAEALDALPQEICEADPARDLLRLRGFAAQMSDNLAVAIDAYEEVVATEPRDWETWNNLGNSRERAGDLAGAIRALRRAGELNPNSAPTRLNLGRALCNAGKFADAEAQYRQMAADFPADEKPLVDLAYMLHRNLGEDARAVEVMEQAAARDPHNSDLLVELGQLQLLIFAVERAEESFRRALELQPNNANAFVGLANILEHHRPSALSDLLAEAEALHIDEAALGLLRAFTALRQRDYEAGIEALEQVPEDLEPERRWQLQGQLLERAGKCDSAFEAFSRMNAAHTVHWSDPLRRASELRRTFRSQLQRLTPEWRDGWAAPLTPATRPAPAFLLGFPRSGTTLLDTMLMGHPQVEVMEERPVMVRLEEELGGFESIASMDGQNVRRAQERYFEIASEYAELKEGSLLVDKAPLHSLRMPQIIRLFPNAKFILALRHPADVVLSCFIANFRTNSAMANFLQLDTAAEFYDLSFALWERSIELFSPDVHTVSYEEMIGDPEQVLKQLTDYLGLTWDPALLDHERTARTRGLITTASYAQVVEPLYGSSIDRWKRYRKHLAPVLPMLRPWIEKFGYAAD